jgi:hypothetical protein
MVSSPNALKRTLWLRERNATHRGDIPTIKIGKLLRVPVKAMEQKLDEVGQTNLEAKA